MFFILREIHENELVQLLALYTHLHGNRMPEYTPALKLLWEEICKDKNHHIIVKVEDDKIVSSCVLLVVPNLTHDQKPYGLIENVVTHTDYRGRGYGTKVLDYAKGIALLNNCYKLMLMTGVKQESTLRFYEKAGYNRVDKTAFIQWLS